MMRNLRYALSLGVTFVLAIMAARPLAAQDGQYFLYIGTYTGFKYVHHSMTFGVGQSQSKGIYVSRYQPNTGEFSPPELAAETVNPSFLAVDPNHRFLYSVSEDPLSLGPPKDHASYVSAFSIDPATGKLRLLNTLPTGGTSTCFISVDKTGRYVFLANFGSGSISVLRIKQDGSLGELTAFIQHLGHGVDPAIQTGPHPHSILVSPDNQFVIVSDLGLDKIFVYRFDEHTGQLSPTDAPYVTVQPGGGPRHFTFDPAGKFGYQISEMSGLLNVFAWDPTNGTLTNVQEIPTQPSGLDRTNHSAEIEVDPKGRFLYESNRRTKGETIRGPDTIGVFQIDQATGKLTQVQESLTGGTMPRNFAIDPTGKLLLAANQLTNNIVLYKIDPDTGKLSPAAKELKADTPVCLVFVPIAR